MSRDEVIDLIRDCKFVVLPSEWYENYPYAVLEAFACGKAVIGSRTGGIPELVIDNETGLTFEMGNSDELSQKISHLLKNPEIALRLGENARSFVKQELNPEKHYEKLMEVYMKLIPSK